MKKTIFVVLLLVSVTTWGQNTRTYPPQTQVRPTLPGVISANPNQAQNGNQTQNGLGSGILSNVVGLAGNYLSNRFGLNNPMALSNAMVYSNLFNGGNIALGDVEGLLQNLQLNIEQVLPILSSLTGSGNMAGSANANGAINSNTGIGNTTTTTTTAGTTTVSPGINSTAPSTAIQSGTLPNQSASRNSPFLPASPILPNPGNPNLRVLPNGQIVNNTTGQVVQNGQTFTGTLGTNSFQMDQQTYQFLIALQNDLQQTLPILQNLQSGSVALNNSAGTANTGAGFTNRFTRILQNRGVLLPTGR